jgi:ABC-type transporter Mla subunit MlaD
MRIIDGVQTVITQMAALTTQSQLTASTTAETNASVTTAINQLAANQQAIQQQLASFAPMRNTTYQLATPTPPPMQQFNILNFGTF